MAKNLRVRKLADKTTDPDHQGGYPYAGLSVEHAPDKTRVSAKFVRRGQSEGWLELEGQRHVVRPSGPADDPWGGSEPPHVFQHADTVVLKGVDGDVRYKVVRQPDKYATSGDEDPVTPEIYAAYETAVDWFYELEREG